MLANRVEKSIKKGEIASTSIIHVNTMVEDTIAFKEHLIKKAYASSYYRTKMPYSFEGSIAFPLIAGYDSKGNLAWIKDGFSFTIMTEIKDFLNSSKKL